MEGSAIHNEFSGIKGSSGNDDQLGVEIGISLYENYKILTPAVLHQGLYSRRLDYTENVTRIKPKELGIIFDNNINLA